jgi:hypothetical protein
MRKLPVGMQNFEEIIQDERVYVNKTDLVYKLAAATNSKQYFLGRPRRFGKSLLVSTLKAYFEGKKELFQGLALGKLEKDWRRHPVIHLDMSRMGADLGVFEDRLIKRLQVHEKLWDLPGDGKSDATTRFSELIENACEKFGEQVVVLIDEYDQQLVGSINDLTLNNSFREKLKDFYGILKSTDECLRFSFLTGVTKFSKVSVFSDLNHLRDISMNPDYAKICGITLRELEDNFGPELKTLATANSMTYDEAITEMRKNYDGYHFSKLSEGIFNPFSILNALADKEFAHYWFETGTPTFLIKLLERDRFDLSKFAKGVTIPANSITDYRADSKNPVPILYQSGYLTIKSYDKEYNEYLLDFPNEEVRGGFLDELLRSYAPEDDYYAKSFKRALLDGDMDKFLETARTFFAGIPYDLNDRAAAAQKEGYYQGLVYAILTLTGLTPAAEKRSAAGRSDLVVETKNAVYIFEFKLDKSADEALRQIEEKGYAAPYAMTNKKIVKIGVNFDSKTRNIAEWKEGASHA